MFYSYVCLSDRGLGRGRKSRERSVLVLFLLFLVLSWLFCYFSWGKYDRKRKRVGLELDESLGVLCGG